MSTSKPNRHGPGGKPLEDRRAAPDAKAAPGSLRWVKGALGRPLKLERQGAHLQVVLVDRRRTPATAKPESTSQLRAELRARLRDTEHNPAVRVMRHLIVVHDELTRKGWAGVGALPSKVIGHALMQTEMLASQEASASLATLVERLGALKAAALAREERKTHLHDLAHGESPEVSETTHEEFEEMERSWLGTVPAVLTLPEAKQ